MMGPLTASAFTELFGVPFPQHAGLDLQLEALRAALDVLIAHHLRELATIALVGAREIDVEDLDMFLEEQRETCERSREEFLSKLRALLIGGGGGRDRST